jgi:hypothetical protein
VRDRSLARSAWKNATQKSRPVGHGVIEDEGRRRNSLNFWSIVPKGEEIWNGSRHPTSRTIPIRLDF